MGAILDYDTVSSGGGNAVFIPALNLCSWQHCDGSLHLFQHFIGEKAHLFQASLGGRINELKLEVRNPRLAVDGDLVADLLGRADQADLAEEVERHLALIGSAA